MKSRDNRMWLLGAGRLAYGFNFYKDSIGKDLEDFQQMADMICLIHLKDNSNCCVGW